MSKTTDFFINVNALNDTRNAWMLTARIWRMETLVDSGCHLNTYQLSVWQWRQDCRGLRLHWRHRRLWLHDLRKEMFTFTTRKQWQLQFQLGFWWDSGNHKSKLTSESTQIKIGYFQTLSSQPLRHNLAQQLLLFVVGVCFVLTGLAASFDFNFFEKNRWVY